jgi:carbamoyltransferase
LSEIETLAAFEPENRAHRELAAKLRDRLVEIGFAPERAAALFGVQEIADVRASRGAYYDAFVLPRDAAGRAARFFVLHGVEPDADLRAWLGDDLKGFLRELDAIVAVERGWRSIVSATWFAGRLILADARAYNVVWPGDPFPDYVMPPGGDSVGLMRVAPRTPRRATLDLCCGAGAQGLAAAAFSDEVVGVDLNRRALRFARFNAAANRIENATFVLGDCYEPLGGTSFGAILANPPFVPRPETDALLYRGGGPLGDDVVARILAGAGGRLDAKGFVAIVADFANVDSLPQRMRAWQDRSRRTLLLLQNRYALVNYAEAHAAHLPEGAPREAEMIRLMRHFEDAGIRTMDFGYVVQGAEAGDAHVMRTPAALAGDLCGDVTDWFRHQERLAGGEIDDVALSLAPRTAVVSERVKAADGSTAESRQFLPGPGSLHEARELAPAAFDLLGRVAGGTLRRADLWGQAERDSLDALLDEGIVRLRT